MPLQVIKTLALSDEDQRSSCDCVTSQAHSTQCAQRSVALRSLQHASWTSSQLSSHWWYPALVCSGELNSKIKHTHTRCNEFSETENTCSVLLISTHHFVSVKRIYFAPTPRIRTFDEKMFLRSFLQKNIFGGFVSELKLVSTCSSLLNFPDEMIRITSKDMENMEICPFSKIRQKTKLRNWGPRLILLPEQALIPPNSFCIREGCSACWMAQMPRAGTGDSTCTIRRHTCSILTSFKSPRAIFPRVTLS